jgi:hypothetical protein
VRGELLEAREPRLGLGLPPFRILAHPLELLLDRLLARALGRLFLLEPLVLLLEPRAVVALPGNAVPAVELEDPLGGVVEEVAVVRDRDHGAGKLGEELLEPLDALRIEMVGRLVEEQHVGLGEEEPAQRDAALLAARERPYLRVPRRQAQRVGRDLEQVLVAAAARRRDHGFVLGLLGRELVEIGVGLRVGGVDRLELLLRLGDLAQALLDRLAHALVGIELGLLRQKADAHVGHRLGLAVELGVLARHDPEQARLAGAVQAQHADLGAGEERERDVLEDCTLRRHGLADPAHGVDVLSHR